MPPQSPPPGHRPPYQQPYPPHRYSPPPQYPGQQRYAPPQYARVPVQQAPPPKRRNRLGIVLSIIAGIVVLIGVVAVIGSGVDRSPGAGPGAAVAVPAGSAEVITVPNVVGMTGNDAVQALIDAGATNVLFMQWAAGNQVPKTQPVTEQSPAAGTQTSSGQQIDLVLQDAPAREITSREWAVIAKAPDEHRGERLIVFGRVTQFDSVTGTDAFRANVDGERQQQEYDYDVNTILQGSATQLADVVTDDIFRAEVTVLGSYSYETTMGGTLTVPMLQVNAISRV